MKTKLAAETTKTDLQVISGNQDRAIVYLPPDQYKSLKIQKKDEDNHFYDRVFSQPIPPPIREARLLPGGAASNLVMAHGLNTEISQQFNRIVIGLINGATKKQATHRILVASTHHREGRTWVILNLATALARAGQRVLIIDTDLKRPSIHRLLGVETEYDLVDVVSSRVPVESALVRVLPVGFDILPTRMPVENSVEILASSKLRYLISALEFNYDFVLFDSPPMLTSSDAGFLVLHTYATLMVVEPGITSTIQMSKAVSQLREESLLGVVLNRVN